MARAPHSIDTDLLLAQTRWVQSLALRLVRDRELAEDITQEVLLAALERPPRQAANERSLRAWLAQVVRSVVKVGARTEERRRFRERVAARHEGYDPAWESTERLAQLQRVVGVVEDLDEPYRSTLLLAHVEGLTNEQIAERLDLTPVAVRKRLSRGMQRLRTRLDSDSDRGAWMAALAPLAGLGALEPPALGSGARVGLGVLSAKLAAVVLAVSGAAWWLHRDADVEPLGTIAVAAAQPPKDARGAQATGGPSAAQPGVRASGRQPGELGVLVLERGTGVPLADVPIVVGELGAPAEDPLVLASTDERGRALLALPSGRPLAVTAFGQARCLESDLQHLGALAPGARRTIVFELASGYERTLLGRAVDRRDGRPLANVALHAAGDALDADQLAQGPVLARTDADGHFAVQVPGPAFELVAVLEGYGLVLVRAPSAASAPPTRIALAPTGTLVGLVLDAGGSHASEAQATAWVPRSELVQGAPRTDAPAGSPPDRRLVRWHSSGAAFTLPELPSGIRLAIDVHAAGLAFDPTAIELAPGERRSRVWSPSAPVAVVGEREPLSGGEPSAHRSSVVDERDSKSQSGAGPLFSEPERSPTAVATGPSAEPATPAAPSPPVAPFGLALGEEPPATEIYTVEGQRGSELIALGALQGWRDLDSGGEGSGANVGSAFPEAASAVHALQAMHAMPWTILIGSGVLTAHIVEAGGAEPLPLAVALVARRAPFPDSAPQPIVLREAHGLWLGGLVAGSYDVRLITVDGREARIDGLRLGWGPRELELIVSPAEQASAPSAFSGVGR